MPHDGEPLGRRRHCRSAQARKRRNAGRRERHLRKLEARDVVAQDKYTAAMDPFKLLQFYERMAGNFRKNQQDKCLDELSDGSSKPSACRWFPCDFPQETSTALELAPLRTRLASAIHEVLAQPGITDRLAQWIELPREEQSAESTTLKLLSQAISTSASKLANGPPSCTLAGNKGT
ncbi:hypothetical protein Pmar_PMAR004708 [Perkinsus marinus ATCC 50983]|uniref:Uncharacterized protein n=1 Tax=Perkinsus marinus (strain ATCC 50983 / TXsc) TaxID=423536 RepID=C5KF55_PERM5|nr:hypothetical protein Pmar_PMAR004708 [Perkinsus marinus ATCC 50983]EER16856.1 hypothetical protein Pmar_PMAR004708 [Perkinsus marinus ATCC 50983]|eukprot:XP_002785060.1 hypothetical protein Pmar_PMAR004708 [Perkinsus marinus ATCC 50983]